MCNSETLQQGEFKDTSVGLELPISLTMSWLVQRARVSRPAGFDVMMTLAFLGKETILCHCVLSLPWRAIPQQKSYGIFIINSCLYLYCGLSHFLPSLPFIPAVLLTSNVCISGGVMSGLALLDLFHCMVPRWLRGSEEGQSMMAAVLEVLLRLTAGQREAWRMETIMGVFAPLGLGHRGPTENWST